MVWLWLNFTGWEGKQVSKDIRCNRKVFFFDMYLCSVFYVPSVT